MSTADQRPALGTVAAGQVVIVYPSGMGNRYSSAKATRAVVVKVGRVWIDVAPEDAGDHLAYYDTRFRMDTQRNGNGTSTAATFVTEDQYAWDLRLRAVREYLRDAGITVQEYVPGAGRDDPSTVGRWHGHQVELANIIRAHEGLDPL